MTAYQEFINKAPDLKQGKICRLWELEIDREPNNTIEFIQEFLSVKGFKKTGIKKDNGGMYQPIYNDKYIYGGAVQDGNKIAIKINQI